MSANLSVEQSLMKAKSHVKKGDLAEAQKLYETILQNIFEQHKSTARNRRIKQTY